MQILKRLSQYMPYYKKYSPYIHSLILTGYRKQIHEGVRV